MTDLLHTWHGLGLPAQNALSWAVNVGGRPWTSDLPALAHLAAHGYAVVRPDGTWGATRAGRDLLPDHEHDPYRKRPAACPACGGAGIVDTSPPGVDRHPWLQTDIDCPECAGTEPDEES